MISICQGTWHFEVFRAWGLVTSDNSSKALALNDLNARQWWPQTWGRTVGVLARRGQSVGTSSGQPVDRVPW